MIDDIIPPPTEIKSDMFQWLYAEMCYRLRLDGLDPQYHLWAGMSSCVWDFYYRLWLLEHRSKVKSRAMKSRSRNLCSRLTKALAWPMLSSWKSVRWNLSRGKITSRWWGLQSLGFTRTPDSSTRLLNDEQGQTWKYWKWMTIWFRLLFDMINGCMMKLST